MKRVHVDVDIVSMDELPVLCLELIAEKVLNDLPQNLHHIAAGQLALVGNRDFTTMARKIWDVIEPGCMQREKEAYHEKLAEWERLFLEASFE